MDTNHNAFDNDIPTVGISEVEALPSKPRRATAHRVQEGLINGAYAQRGMALKINEMLAMGCYTVADIVNCLTPMTKDGDQKQAINKLKAHISNLHKNGCRVFPIDARILACADVVLPE